MTSEESVRFYLETHRRSVEGSTIEYVASDIKQKVFLGMCPLRDDKLREVIVRWATFNAPGMLLKSRPLAPNNPSLSPASTPPASAFVDQIRKVIKLATDGVRVVGNDNNHVVIKATGPMAQATVDNAKLSAGVGWTGTLWFRADRDDLHFMASISKDSWEMSISYPKETPIPNLTKAAASFQEVGQAIADVNRSVVAHGIDPARISGIIKPHLAAAGDALEAAQGIGAHNKRGGPSFGFKMGSPPPMTGQQGIPPGVQGQITLTWTF